MNNLQQTWLHRRKSEENDIPGCLIQIDTVTKNIQELIDGHRIPLEDEKKIFSRIRGGDRGVLEWFVYSKMELVRITARTLIGNMIEFNDLIQFGLIGLLDAINKHDVDKGHFDHYARQRIQGTMQDAIRHEMCYLSNGSASRNVPKIRNAYNLILQKKLGIKPTIQELIEETGLSEKIILNYFQLNYLVRLEDISASNNDNNYDFFCQAHTYEINKKISESEYDKILSAVKDAYENMHLSDIERYIMERYYGLDGKDPIRFHEIGKNYGYTEGRISQIHKEIILRLKKYIKSKGYCV